MSICEYLYIRTHNYEENIEVVISVRLYSRYPRGYRIKEYGQATRVYGECLGVRSRRKT